MVSLKIKNFGDVMLFQSGSFEESRITTYVVYFDFSNM